MLATTKCILRSRIKPDLDTLEHEFSLTIVFRLEDRHILHLPVQIEVNHINGRFQTRTQSKTNTAQQKLLVRREKLSKCFHKPRKVRTCKPWLRGWVASGSVNGLQRICFRYSSKASENGVLRYCRLISHATGKCSSAATATRGSAT